MSTVYYPASPVPDKRKSTLLDVATVDRNAGAYLHKDGPDLWASYNSLEFGQSTTGFCAPSDAKDLTQLAKWIDGFRFAVYGGVECKTMGLDMAEQKAAVTAAFERGESKGVERALLDIGFQVSDGTDPLTPGIWDAATDITPGSGAVSAKAGISLLEEYAASVYTGLGTLHVPISVAEVQMGWAGADYIKDVLHTKLGTPMAVGAGYALPSTGPDGTEAAEGERWCYVSGTVWIAPAPEVIIRQVLDPPTNNVTVLAERAYLAAIDGFTAAIRVTLD